VNILALKTVGDLAEVGVYVNGAQLAKKQIPADRQLSKDLLACIDDALKSAQVEKTEIQGVAVYSGPGSFTGLRIGVTVANTIASSLDVGCVGISGDNWSEDAIIAAQYGVTFAAPVVCEYGGEANITKPKR